MANSDMATAGISNELDEVQETAAGAGMPDTVPDAVQDAVQDIPQDVDQGDDQTEGSLESLFSDSARSLRDAVPQEQPAAEAPIEPVAQPAEQPVQPSSLDMLLGQARELGIPVDGMQSEADLASAVIEQIKSMQPHVRFAQQQYAQQRAPQPVAAPPQAPAQPAGQQNQWDAKTYLNEKYGGPAWKPEFQSAIESGMVSRDPETGLWASLPGYEASTQQVLGEMNAAQQHSAKFWQGLAASNPYESFYEVLREPLLREVESRVSEALRREQETTQRLTFVEQFEQDNSQWLYAVDPSTGQQVPTEQGGKFLDVIDEYRAKGITDPKDLLEIAQLKMGIQQPVTQPPAQQAPQQATQQPASPIQQAWQQQSGAQQPVAGQVPAPAEPKQSFIDSALQRASHSPSASGTVTDDAPQVMSEGDLNSLFERAFRQASHN